MFAFIKKLTANKNLSEQQNLLSESEKNTIDDYLNCTRHIKNNAIDDVQLIAVDFETTGLNFENDEIISMGFCPVKEDIIRLQDCVHIMINTQQNLTSENVAIHGLTDDMLSQGVTPRQAFFKFIELVKNNTIIAHHHSIERKFIQKLALTILGHNIPLSFIDTYHFAKLRMQRRQQTITQDSLRLFNLRRKFGLPNYNAHNALEDAISTAELYLAQKASLNLPNNRIRLKEMGLFNYKT